MTEKNSIGKFYGVGIGPGDPGLVTLRAAEVLKTVDVIFHVAGPRTHKSISGGVVDSIEGCKGHRHELIFSMNKDVKERETAWQESADRVVAEVSKGHNVAFVTLGDPLIYSTFGYLRKKVLAQLPDLEIEVIPGITSFQAAAALKGVPLVEDKETLKVIPAADNGIASDDILNGADTAVLLKTYKHRNETLEELKEAKDCADILYAARVGLDNQVIEEDPDKVAELPREYFSMLIAKKKKHD